MRTTAYNALTALAFAFTLAIVAGAAQAAVYTPTAGHAQLSQFAAESKSQQCPGEPGRIVKDGQGCTILP